MGETFSDRVRAVRWGDFEGSCGYSTVRIPELLILLNGADPAIAMSAASGLWNVLCHQHNCASVDVPALPFLLEVLDRAPDTLAVEVMDMLYGFAACAGWYRRKPPPGGEPDWVSELRARLEAEGARFRRLASHLNEDIAGFAQLILEADGPR